MNDVTFAPDGSAFVTDSVNPVLYRIVPDGPDKYRLEEYVHWNVQQLNWVRAPGAPGINFNGVVVTPDGKYLILSKRNDSSLYRFKIATKEINEVQLPDGAVFTQDGLFIDGRTVYAAQNSPQSVAILDFAPDYASATKRGEITDPTFRFPTSVAKIGDRLIVMWRLLSVIETRAALLPKMAAWAVCHQKPQPGCPSCRTERSRRNGLPVGFKRAANAGRTNSITFKRFYDQRHLSQPYN